MAEVKPKPGKVLAAKLDSAELTLRIAEACLAMRRPPGTTAKDALEQLRRSQPEIVAGFDRAAVRALEYVVESINSSGHYAEMN